MKRRPRILRRTAMSLSVLLLIAMAVLWVRSAWIADRWTHNHIFERDNAYHETRTAVATNGRALAFQIVRLTFLPDDPGKIESLRRDLPAVTSFFHAMFYIDAPTFPASGGVLGFFWQHDVSDPPTPPGQQISRQHTTRYGAIVGIGGNVYVCDREEIVIAVPWWFLTLLFATTPAIALLRRYRAHRAPRPGCCKQCGYDLRASPNRCPECGASAATK